MLIKKKELLNEVKDLLNKQLEDIRSSIDKVTESIKGEEKSSAGDKYETSRAMGHIDLDNLNKRLDVLLRNGNIINRINSKTTFETVQLGTLVKTSERILFFSVGLGAVELHGEKILTMSLGSPIGQLFLNKKVGDVIEFNKVAETIVEIY